MEFKINRSPLPSLKTVMVRSQPWAFLMPLPFKHKVYPLKDSKSIMLVGYSGAKWAGWGAQIKAMGTRYPGALPARPVKQNWAISQIVPSQMLFGIDCYPFVNG
jgi:hypothetical protein